MNQAMPGDTVKIKYEAKLTDGKVFDSSYKKDPIKFTIGKGQVISGLEQMIVGMQPGETKTTMIKADQAFGQHAANKVVKMDRNLLPETLEIEPGKRFQGRKADGTVYFVRVVEVSDSGITVDMNHPLAGQDLIFDVELVEIE